MLEFEMVYPLHVQLAGGKAKIFTIPLLYLIYDEAMIRETGISVGVM